MAVTPLSTVAAIEPVNDAVHIRILTLCASEVGLDWNVRSVCTSYWRLYVNNRDGAAVAWSEGVYSLKAHRVHLVPAWVRFDCRGSRVPLEHFWVHFDLIGLSGAIVREIFGRPFTLPRGCDAERLAKPIRVRAGQGIGDDLALLAGAKSMVYAAISELIESLPPPDRERCRRFLFAPNPVRPAIRYIDEHLAEPLSTPLLAERCGLSPDHFARVFAGAVGQTPAQYVIERRVATAAQRLLFGSESIDAIAEETGFANRFHFSRAFARRIGVPPAQYRKRTRV